MKIEKNARNVAIGTAAAGALAIALVVAGTGGSTEPPVTDPDGSGAGSSSGSGSGSTAPATGRLKTDLLSSTIAPGEAADAVVVLPHGSTLVPGFALTGEAVGRFEITGTNLTEIPDGIRLSVWFRNTSTASTRFTADILYDVPLIPPSSPSVPVGP